MNQDDTGPTTVSSSPISYKSDIGRQLSRIDERFRVVSYSVLNSIESGPMPSVTSTQEYTVAAQHHGRPAASSAEDAREYTSVKEMFVDGKWHPVGDDLVWQVAKVHSLPVSQRRHFPSAPLPDAKSTESRMVDELVDTSGDARKCSAAGKALVSNALHTIGRFTILNTDRKINLQFKVEAKVYVNGRVSSRWGDVVSNGDGT